MRRPLVSSSRTAVTGLCKTCLEAQARRARAPMRAVSTTATTVQPLRTRPTIRDSARAQCPFAPVIYSRNASTGSEQARASPTRPAQQVPRFYALFPETLPNGPPPAGEFQVDVRALRREFLRLQAAAHPDFHHAASGPSDSQAAARARAEAASATINEAYKTLSSPLLRAQYLLHELHDADLAGDEAGGVVEANPDLLMMVLDVREAIEDATSEADLEELRSTNDERIRASEDGLAAAFRDGDVNAAKAEAVRLRYWVNIKESLDNWESGKPVTLQH